MALRCIRVLCWLSTLPFCFLFLSIKSIDIMEHFLNNYYSYATKFNCLLEGNTTRGPGFTTEKICHVVNVMSCTRDTEAFWLAMRAYSNDWPSALSTNHTLHCFNASDGRWWFRVNFDDLPKITCPNITILKLVGTWGFGDNCIGTWCLEGQLGGTWGWQG